MIDFLFPFVCILPSWGASFLSVSAGFALLSAGFALFSAGFTWRAPGVFQNPSGPKCARECPPRVSPKAGVSEGASHGVSSEPLGPWAPECPNWIWKRRESDTLGDTPWDTSGPKDSCSWTTGSSRGFAQKTHREWYHNGGSKEGHYQ